MLSSLFSISATKATAESGEVSPTSTQKGMWSSVASMSVPRFGLAAASYNEVVFAIGGYGDGWTMTNVVERFDTELSSGTWIEDAPMKSKRAGHAAVVLDGSIYAIGGFNGRKAQSSAEYYHVKAASRWKAAPSMTEPRAGLAATVLDGRIYALGGQVESRSAYSSVSSWSRSTALGPAWPRC